MDGEDMCELAHALIGCNPDVEGIRCSIKLSAEMSRLSGKLVAAQLLAKAPGCTCSSSFT